MSELSHAIELKAEQWTSRTQMITGKQQKPLKLKKSNPRRQVAGIIDGKNHRRLQNNRTGRDAQLKNLSLIFKKTRQERDISVLVNPLKKSDRKIKKN